jgi:hypothetical protein
VIPYLRLAFTLRAQAPARLPPFKGSMLRGAFGHALRRTVCAMGPQQPCESCRLRRACVYTRIFETFIEGPPPPLLRGLPTSPRPYIFEPRDEQRDFAPGDPLAFDLLLVGQAAELQAYAQLAVERMAAAGLGVRRVPFALDRVEAQAPDGSRLPLFADGRALATAAPPPSLPPTNGLEGSRATIRLLTPLRLKIHNGLAGSVTFRELAFAMLRRVLELAWFHVPGAEIDWHFRPLLDQAAALRSTPHLAWHDWERYSNRQQTKMVFGGLLGTLDLEGDLAPFAPLLRTAEILHVGKGATFGLGRIAVEGGGTEREA